MEQQDEKPLGVTQSLTTAFSCLLHCVTLPTGCLYPGHWVWRHLCMAGKEGHQGGEEGCLQERCGEYIVVPPLVSN